MVLLLSGTGAATATAPPPPGPATDTAEPDREWTIIYYGIADNDLELSLMTDVLEMGAVNFGPEVTVYGLIDRSSWDFSYTEPDGTFVPDGDLGPLGTFTGAKAYVARGGQLIEMADLGEVDMGHPNTLAWFVAEVMRVAPAKRTALIMSDHGLGPLGVGPDYSTVVGEHTPDDDASGNSDEQMSLEGAEIARSLQLGLRGKKLDLIAFDACLMGNLDMARFVSQYADVMVASEDIVPGLGFDYTALEVIAEQPTLGAEDLGRAIIDYFGRFYQPIELDMAITMAMYDLEAIERLDAATASLARALRSADAKTAFGAAVAASQAQITLDPGYDSSVDLGDLARRLAQPGNPDEVRVAADAVFAAAAASVLHQYRGIGRADATGISITTFPESLIAAYRTHLPPYWVEWMSYFLGESVPLPPTAADVWTTTEASLQVSADGVAVTGQLRPDVASSGAVVGATAMFGSPVGGGGVEVAIRYPAVLNSGAPGAVAASWGLSSFVLDDGATTVRPTVELEQNSEGLVGTILGRLSSAAAGSRVAALRFSIDPASGAASPFTVFVQQSTGAWSQHQIGAGDRFVADVQEVSADGSEIALVPAPAVALDQLELRANRQTTGAFAAALGALGADGTVAALIAQGELP